MKHARKLAHGAVCEGEGIQVLGTLCRPRISVRFALRAPAKAMGRPGCRRRGCASDPIAALLLAVARQNALSSPRLVSDSVGMLNVEVNHIGDGAKLRLDE